MRLRPCRRSQRPAHGGAVLMEVVLALTLFVAAASILSSALSASVDSVDRQKKQLQASNLALSILAELKMGARALESQSIAFDAPFEDWTAETVVASAAESGAGESGALTRVEVVVRHKTSSVVARFGQLIDLSGSAQTAMEGQP